MKLLALRAAQFRRFFDGIAVEGFAPGVNLLAGPNEAGKSTLFEALEAAFLMRHGATGAALEALRPRGGGEPLIEADFEAGGRRWRIRKQFGRGKAAVLSDLNSGRVIARAGEAEDQLSALTGARSDGPGRIGLVWVRQQRALLAPDPDVEPLTGKPRARGEHNALVSLLSAEVVEAAGSGLAEEVLKRVRAELDTFVNPARAGARKNGPYDRALAARQDAQAALEKARAAAAQSEARLIRIAEISQQLSALEDVSEKAALDGRVALLEKAVSEALAQRERDKAAADRARACDLEAREARRMAVNAKTAAARCRELRQALTQAQALQATIKSLAAAINANAATPARLAALQTSFSLARREEQALEEMSTFVDITPEAGAAQAILAEGQAIGAHTRIPVAERLTLTIAGAGRIDVTSSDATRAAAARRRRDEHSRDIARLLAETGAATFEEAGERAAARETANLALDEHRRALALLAPHGLPGLEQELAKLEHESATADLASLEAKAVEADVQALAARHALEALRAAGIGEERFARMTADLEALKREQQRRLNDAHTLSGQLERLLGEQAGVDEEGRAGNVERASGACALAESEVSRIEDEIAALKLLATTLQGTIEGVRSRYLEPVSRALLPYLGQVFPGAAAQFREGFSLQALTRAGEREEFATLSDGTREQLAVLVRMGFARLFAERGAAVPLVLDDPLVYSDDARLAAMCGALNAAGALHQVVVLTCRETAFTRLSAHHLALEPWQPVHA